MTRLVIALLISSMAASARADRFVDLSPTEEGAGSVEPLKSTVQPASGIQVAHSGFIASSISEVAHQCTKASVIENIEVGRAFMVGCRTPEPDPVTGDPNHCEACCLNAAVSYLQSVDQLAMMRCATGAQVGDVTADGGDQATSGLTSSQRAAKRRSLSADVQQAQARADLLASELRATGIRFAAGSGVGATRVEFDTSFGFRSSVQANRNYILDTAKCETRTTGGGVHLGAGQIAWCGDRPCAGAKNQAKINQAALERLSFSLTSASGERIRYGTTAGNERVPSPFPVDALDRQRLNGKLVTSELNDAMSAVQVKCDTGRLLAAQRAFIPMARASNPQSGEAGGRRTETSGTTNAPAPLVVQPVDVVRKQVAEARATFRFQPESYRKSFGDDFVGISSANVFRMIQQRYQEEAKRGNFIDGQEAKK